MIINSKDNIYNQSKPFNPDRNVFDYSTNHSRDIEIGKIYPIDVFPVLPGDHIKYAIDVSAYMESLFKNGFYDLRLTLKAFYCRTTDLDPQAEGLFSGGPTGSFDHKLPVTILRQASKFTDNNRCHNLQDCFKLPVLWTHNGVDTYYLNASPYIMYDLIYYSDFIDDMIEPNVPKHIYNLVGYIGDVPENTTDNNRFFYNKDNSYVRMFKSVSDFRAFLVDNGYPECASTDDYSDADIENFLYNCNYIKDRFTSCRYTQTIGKTPLLPIDLSTAFDFAQTGSANALVQNIASTDGTFSGTYGTVDVKTDSPYATVGSIPRSNLHTYGIVPGDLTSNWNTFFQNALKTTVSSFSPIDMRLAFQTSLIQDGVLLGGWQHEDYVKYFFGTDVKKHDPTKPRFLGSWRKPFIVSDVFSTSATQDAPLGSYAGRGELKSDGFLFDASFEDFGYVMVVAYVDTSANFYTSQGIDRMWKARSRFDFYNPAFAHLSNVGTEVDELYLCSASKTLEVFGFNGIWNELRQRPDMVTGNLRDNLDMWTTARNFSSKPVLGPEFLKVKQKDFDHIFSVSSDLYKPFICNFSSKVLLYRNLPAVAIPGLIDHR